MHEHRVLMACPAAAAGAGLLPPTAAYALHYEADSTCESPGAGRDGSEKVGVLGSHMVCARGGTR
jgi:hypothetical protein